MADYYAILKRAVSSLPEGSREQRQAVYDKARKALLAQLQQMDPPLAPSDISKQRVSLEEAIRSVELDLSKAQEAGDAQKVETFASIAQSKGSGEAEDGKTSVSSQKSETATSDHKPPVGVAPTVELKKDAKTDAAPDAPSDSPKAEKDQVASSSVPTGEKADKVSDDKVADEAQTGSSDSDKLVRRAGQDVLKNAVRDANALGTATSAAVKSAQETADIVGEKRDGEAARIEPTLGDAVVSNSKTYQREQQREPSDPKADLSASPVVEDRQEKQSQTGLLIAVLLLMGGLGISAYLLYQNKDAFLGEETSTVAEVQTEAPDADEPVDEVEEMPSKTVRTVVVTPDGVATTRPAEEAPEADAVEPEQQPEPVEPPAADQAETATDQATAPVTDDAVSNDPQPALPVAQRSIFYEEESAGSKNGRATQGQAVWSLDGEGDAATVKVDVAVPDRNVGFSISLKKNLDPELPASHLIEVISTHSNPDEPRVIDSIPGLILKPTEQSRGVGLAGAAIRIADDMYWIALKSEPQAVKYNIELLVLRSWIDMPILYKSGRRAILTLEKGDAGAIVIRDALLEWGLLKRKTE